MSEVTQAEQTVADEAATEVAAVKSEATGFVAKVEAEVHVVVAALVIRIHELETYLGMVKPAIPAPAAPQKAA